MIGEVFAIFEDIIAPLRSYVVPILKIFYVLNESVICIYQDEMKDISWQLDIRQAVEELVRKKRRKILLKEARELRQATKNIGISASELTREDRDARESGPRYRGDLCPSMIPSSWPQQRGKE